MRIMFLLQLLVGGLPLLQHGRLFLVKFVEHGLCIGSALILEPLFLVLLLIQSPLPVLCCLLHLLDEGPFLLSEVVICLAESYAGLEATATH